MSRAVPLSEEQIETAFQSAIRPPSWMSGLFSKAWIAHMRDLFLPEMRKVRLIPRQFDNFVAAFGRGIEKAHVQPGEPVGPVSAQSISAPLTQQVLNVFHHSGISEKNATLGLTRLKELLNITASPKITSCSIYFRPEIQSRLSCMDDVRDLIGDCLNCNLGILNTNISIICSPKWPSWVEQFSSIFGNSYLDAPWAVKFSLNAKKLSYYRMSLSAIAEAIESEFADLVCVYPPYTGSAKHLEFWVVVDVSMINADTTAHFSTDEAPYMYIHDVVVPTLIGLNLGQVSGMTKMFPRKLESGEWMVETEGACTYSQVLALEFVDSRRTKIDNVRDIFVTLGLTAARHFLVDEFIRVASFDGTHISREHIELLVDSMTYLGNLNSVSRYGIQNDVGPLARMTFEEMVRNLIAASANGETEEGRGLAASVAMGKTVQGGTGMMTVLADPKSLGLPKNMILTKPAKPSPLREVDRQWDDMLENTNVIQDIELPGVDLNVNAVWKTLHIVLNTRGYKVCEFNLSTRILIGERTTQTGEIERILVYYPDDDKFSKAHMDQYIFHCNKNRADSGIIVYGDKLTPHVNGVLTSDTSLAVEAFGRAELLVDITSHVLVDPHIRMTAEAKQKFLTRFGPTHVRKILQTDPVVKFHGWKTGDLIYIGTTPIPDFRLVVVGNNDIGKKRSKNRSEAAE